MHARRDGSRRPTPPSTANPASSSPPTHLPPPAPTSRAPRSSMPSNRSSPSARSSASTPTPSLTRPSTSNATRRRPMRTKDGTRYKMPSKKEGSSTPHENSLAVIPSSQPTTSQPPANAGRVSTAYTCPTTPTCPGRTQRATTSSPAALTEWNSTTLQSTSTRLNTNQKEATM